MLNNLVNSTKDDCYKEALAEVTSFAWVQAESRSAGMKTIVQGGQVFRNETTNGRLFQTEIVSTSELQNQFGNTASVKANSQMIRNHANTAEADIKG